MPTILSGPFAKEFDMKNPLQLARASIGVNMLHLAASADVATKSPALARHSASDALRRLERLLKKRDSITLLAVILGAVHYRQGEGIAFEVDRGVVHLEVTCTDTVLSWDDDKCRVQAAIPYADFSHYVTAGAIRLGI